MAPNVAGAAAPVYYYTGVQYAGFWLRLVAYLIDGIVMGISFVILLIPIVLLTGAGTALSRISSGEDPGDVAPLFGVAFVLAIIVLVFAAPWLYYALLESSSWQGTVGKKILNLKVTDMAGNPVSFGRASGRFFAKFITGLIPLMIGYILAGFTEKKQAIHDMIASCLVLRRV
jgi:uncharacterized RDD family membrane protein YckC